MTTIILKPHKEESVLRFHPWVFSGAIARIVLDATHRAAAPEEGELVCVQSADEKVLGAGHWQVGSIAVRLLAFGDERISGTEDEWIRGLLLKRIAAAYRMRQRLGLLREDNNTYRLIHGEGDMLPGLVVDVYGSTAVVQAHSVGMHLCRKEIAEAITEEVKEITAVYYKSDDTLPFKAPIEGDKTGWLIAQPINLEIPESPDNPAPEEYGAKENGIDVRIDWLRGQKTGFFIDQRENRALVERYAAGKDVLNMFCYTGGFSLYALRGGAKSVHSVDVSQKAIDLVNANVERNFPKCTNHKAVTADAFDYLSEQRAQGHQYDLIILDPPAFAKHRDAVKNALRGYQRINAKAIEMIRPGGILFTFSCSQAVDKEAFRLAVFSAAAQTGRKVRILHQLHQPQDHPINIYHPEGEYLKGLVLYVE